MPTFSDLQTTFAARLAANAPQMTTAPTSILVNVANAFLSADADTAVLIAGSAPNMFLATAAGTPGLDNKAADYGAVRSQGLPSTGAVVFSMPAGQTAPATLTIPIGTVLSTVGDNIVTQAISFVTTTVGTISSGGTASGTVNVQATTSGTLTNVGSGAISIIITQLNFGALTVTNATGCTGGVDVESDASLRDQALANIQPKYAATDIQSEALTVPGIYDCYVYDPQDGSATLAVYNADSSGAVLSGAALTALQAAVLSVLPAGIKTSGVTYPAFTTVNNISAITVTFSAPAAVQTGVVVPLIRAAIVAYVQALVHDQVPTVFGLTQAALQATGYVITNFTYTSSTPTLVAATPANTTLWRLTGGVGVVTVNRV